MADTKISALAAGTAMANAEVTVVVQGGTDVKMSKTLFLTAKAGEILSLLGNAGGFMQFLVSGQVNIASPAGQSCNMADGAGGSIYLDGAGTFVAICTTMSLNSEDGPGADMVFDSGGNIQIDAGAAFHILNGNGQGIIAPLAGPNISLPGTDTSGAFAGGFTDFIAAFFRMAVAVQALQLGTPIA